MPLTIHDLDLRETLQAGLANLPILKLLQQVSNHSNHAHRTYTHPEGLQRVVSDRARVRGMFLFIAPTRLDAILDFDASDAEEVKERDGWVEHGEQVDEDDRS